MFSDPFSFVTYIREHPDQFQRLLTQHLQLTILSILIAVTVAIPLAVLASRVELVAKPMTWFAGVGQTIPSLAILGLMLPFLGIGFRPAHDRRTERDRERRRHCELAHQPLECRAASLFALGLSALK